MNVAFWDFSQGVTAQMMLGALLGAGVDREAWSRAMARVPVTGWSLDQACDGGSSRTFRARILTGNQPVPLSVLRDLTDETSSAPQSGVILSALERAASGVDLELDAAEAIALVGVEVGAGLLALERQWRNSLCIPPEGMAEVAGILMGHEITIRADRPVRASLPGIAAAVSLAQYAAHPVPLRVQAVGIGCAEEPGLAPRSQTPPGVTLTVGTESSQESSTVLEVCATVDDMDPELIPPSIASLREAGALDAWWGPVVTKGGRPGVTIHVLCGAECLNAVTDAMFRETTTIGLRFHEVGRYVLARSERTIRTDAGDVRVKESRLADGTVRWKPESEDCIRAARSAGLTVREVRELVRRSMEGRSRS